MGLYILISLSIQIGDGIILSWSYIADACVAHDLSYIRGTFYWVDYLVRDSNTGFLKRALHCNTAGLILMGIYVHILRALQSGAAPKVHPKVWWTGFSLLSIACALCFAGYVLPWGTMSFWALTVITNVLTVLPNCSAETLTTIWGGLYLSSVTLERFYSIHYLLPLVMVVIVVFHLCVLHSTGSTSQVSSIGSDTDHDQFSSFGSKEWNTLWYVLLGCALGSLLMTDAMHHADNYLPVDRLLTPSHISPEWYFLPYYAILRAIDSKLIGVILLLGSIIQFGILACSTCSLACWGIALGGCCAACRATLGLAGSVMPVFPWLEYSITLTGGIIGWLLF
jgi:quinol-cytochrome oxidoreductase complex cytochrome b subunit